MTPPFATLPRRHTPLGLSCAAAAIGLAVYLISPALTATHVEGFTALIQLDAIAANAGQIGHADLLYPIQTEYFYLTRQGVVLLLRALMATTGQTDDGLFRLLTQLALVTFLACTALLARRHARLPWPAILGAILLVPGLFELGFSFNDNVISAASGLLGLAVLPPCAVSATSRILRSLLAGAALALALLARTDALLLLPLAAGLAWLDEPKWRRLVLLGLLLAAAMLAVFALADALSGATPLQALRIGALFDRLHGGARPKIVRALVFVLFFGLPGLVLAPIGAWRTARSTSLHRGLVLVALPVPILLAALRSATELRQIYPLLAPFVVIWCGAGLCWLRASLLSRRPVRAVALAIVAGIALAWLLPPVFVPLRDGPRALLGRLWSPPLWRAWQGRVDASLDAAAALVADAGRQPRLVVVTAHFNSDHFLQLRAWQAGWRPIADPPERCRTGVQLWRRGLSELVQIRLENPYGIVPPPIEGPIALQLAAALDCPAVTDPGAPVILSDFDPPLSIDPLSAGLRDALPETPPPLVGYGWPDGIAARLAERLAHSHFAGAKVPMTYGIVRNGPLSATQLLAAGALARQEVAASHDLPDAAAFAALFQTRFWHP